MRLTEVFELLEQRDPNTIFIVGDSHASAMGRAGAVRNLAKDGATVQQIASQTQSVPDNSIVLYSGGANNINDNGVEVVAAINRQIRGMRDRGCFVIYVVFPMIQINSDAPSVLPNDGSANDGKILANNKAGEEVELNDADFAAQRAAGELTTVPQKLPLRIVYRNAGYTANFNRVREQIRRNVRADEVLELNTADINPQDPMGIHAKPDAYSRVLNSARQMATAEIQKRADSDFPIGSDIPTGQSFDRGGVGSFVGDLFGIFGAAFGPDEEIPDSDMISYDDEGNPVDAEGNAFDNSGQPQGAQVNVGDLSRGLVDYIKTKEGYGIKINPNDPRSDVRAYDDFGQYSIGFGTRARSAQEVLTYEQAEQRLMRMISQFREGVVDFSQLNGYNWDESQIDALTSFAYNLGLGSLRQVTNNATRSNREIGMKMLEYNKAGGRTLPGLVQRRREESAAFIQGQSNSQLAFRPGASNRRTA